ncbi:hypothetical protein EMPG_12527, partial [Blastomyces silverae]
SKDTDENPAPGHGANSLTRQTRRIKFTKGSRGNHSRKTTTTPNIWVLFDHPDASERKPSNSTSVSSRKCTMTASALGVSIR